MYKEARFWKKIGKDVKCELCPHFCFLHPGELGKCGVRRNLSGRLISLVYGKPCTIALDPIEKKPLYHFLPGQKTLSIATLGCNLKCGFCQNWQISQTSSELIRGLEISPGEIVKEAIRKKSGIIAYTYTEPTIFYEYMLDVCKIARKNKIKNVSVTNGFINPLPLNELCNYLDASNIDLKAFDENFYEISCKGRLKPVLEAIKLMHKNKVWIELTNLIIPGLNDSSEQITKLVDWIKDNLGKNVPLHFSAFHPDYKMTNLPRTSEEILRKARRIAIAKGLNYVYTGNIEDEEGNTTYCPRCKKAVIKRRYFEVIENKLKNGKCSCGEKIAGIWH